MTNPRFIVYLPSGRRLQRAADWLYRCAGGWVGYRAPPPRA